jgi:ribosomal protein S18 acetylase RimI-like enzyme
VDPLDNPILHALTGPHRAFAQWHGNAVRYDPEVAPFAALPDDPGAGDWDSLGELVAEPGGEPGVALLPRADVEVPAGWETTFRIGAVQMLAPDDLDPAAETFDPLGADDVDAMLALAARTRPGPFLARTYELGGYVGRRAGDGTLVAMAGQRMRVPGMTEISAVCTDPGYRGHGLASALVRAVAAQIRARGDRPFLHVADDNRTARRVYERLGFTTRTTLGVTAVRRSGG